MNKKFFRLLFGIILFLNFLFLNMDSAAAKISNNKGYAFCTYTWIQSDSAQSTQYTGEGIATSYTYSYIVGFVAHKSNNKFIISKPNLDCWAEGNECSINNYERLESGLKRYYSEQENWNCPDLIYVDHDGVGRGDLFKVNLSTEGDINFNIEAKASSSQVSNNGSYTNALKKLNKIKAANGSTSTNYIGSGTPPPGVNGMDIVKDIDANDIVAFDTDFVTPNTSDINCDLISKTLMNDLKNFFLLIQVFGIVLLIIMSIIEFIRAITKSDNDGLKQATKNTYKRIIIVVLLLLLPVLVVWVLNIVNANAYVTDKNGKHVIGEDGNPLCSDSVSSSSGFYSSNVSDSNPSNSNSSNSNNEKKNVDIRLNRTVLMLDKSRYNFEIIKAELSIDGVYSAKDIKWSISNKSIARFKKGKKNVSKIEGRKVMLIGLKYGKTKVTAKLPNGKKATCVVRVVKLVKSVKLEKPYYNLSKGSKVVLRANVTPSNATNRKLSWTSSNPNVATVNNNGEVVAKNKGVALITVTARDGSNKSDTCIIDVRNISTLERSNFTLITSRIGGGIETDVGVQGFCIVDNYIVMGIVRNGNATIYLVNKQDFHIYDSINIGTNHANVLSYDSKDKVIFVGNTGQRPVTLKIQNNKLYRAGNRCNRSGQILYNEKNDLFMTANGTSIKVYTRDAFYNNGEPINSFNMSGLGGYVPQGKVTFGNHIYYCISRDTRGKNAIIVYNITTGKLEQTIYDYTKSDTMAELEQAYFDSRGDMYTNYNHGNDFYKTNYNYFKQLKN